MSDQAAPFKVGDRVRWTGKVRRKYPRATVRLVERRAAGPYDDGVIWWRVLISPEGGSPNTRCAYYSHAGGFDWEPIPVSDWTTDEVSRALARAVLDGDREAARALHDRLTELFNEGG